MPPIPGSSMASRSRHYYKFRMFNRSYEGYYTYGEFMENCMIVNRNQFPFLPKSLLVARCKTTWDNLLKASHKEPKSPPSKLKKKHSSTTSGSSKVDKPDEEEVFKKPLIPKKSSLSKSASQRSILDFDSGDDENKEDVSSGSSSSNSSWNHLSPTYKSTPFKAANSRTDLNNNNNDSQSSTSSCSNRSKSRNLIQNVQDHFHIVNSSRSSSQQSSNSSCSSSTNSSSKSSKRNMNDRQSKSISLSSSDSDSTSSSSSVRCKSSTSKTFVGLFDEPDEIDTRNLIQISDSSSNSSNTSPKKRKTLFSKPLPPADLSNRPPILTTTIEEADPLSTISLDSLSSDLSQQQWSISSQLASGSSHHHPNSQSLRSNIDLSSAILNQYGKSSICSEPIELEFGDFSVSTTSSSRRSSSRSSSSQSEDQPQDTSQQIMIRHIDSSSSSNSSNQSG